MSHYFQKLLSFQATFGNYGIRFLRPFKKILKIWPMFIPVFALIRGHHYTRSLRLIWDPCISAVRPRIDLCTKNPPANDHDERNTLYLSKIETLIFFQHVQLDLISLIFLCSDIAYVLKQRKWNQQTERNNYFRGTSCWIIKHRITNWFHGWLFKFFPIVVFVFFSFSPFFSLFLFLLLSFF